MKSQSIGDLEKHNKMAGVRVLFLEGELGVCGLKTN